MDIIYFQNSPSKNNKKTKKIKTKEHGESLYKNYPRIVRKLYIEFFWISTYNKTEIKVISKK